MEWRFIWRRPADKARLCSTRDSGSKSSPTRDGFGLSLRLYQEHAAGRKGKSKGISIPFIPHSLTSDTPQLKI